MPLTSRPAKVLLLGYAGFGNAGDEALLSAQVVALRAQDPSVELRVVSGNPAATLRVHGVDGVGRTDLVALQKALRWCDALVVGGGSLLQDVTSARPVAFYAGLALAASRLGKTVCWYAVGLGPIRRRANQRLAARALRRADYLSVRDPASLALADELGVIGAELVGDPVLAGVPGVPPVVSVPPVITPQAGRHSKPVSRARPRLAVALRSWADDYWYDEMVTALTVLAGETEIVLVPMDAQQDVAIAEALARSVGANLGEVVEVVAPDPDGGYLPAFTALQSADVVLGMRLHSLIAGAAAGKPVVAISYDPKVDAFAAQLGVEVSARVTSGSVEAGAGLAERVVTSVRTAVTMPDVTRKEYAAAVTEMARSCSLPARRTMALVAKRISGPEAAE